MSWLAEAHAAYPWQEGRYYPDRAWLLSPFDVWMRNPFYSGPPVPHPEDPLTDEVRHWALVLSDPRADRRLR